MTPDGAVHLERKLRSVESVFCRLEIFINKWIAVCDVQDGRSVAQFTVFTYISLPSHYHLLWVKKYIEYEVEASRPRGRPKKTLREVMVKDCQARKLNKEGAMDRCRWRKLTKDVR